MALAGNLVLDSYIVLDLNDVPLTGMLSPADVTLTLFRQSGSTMVAASETVAWSEVGVTGTYYFTFTPEHTGLYMLHLKEVDALTALRQQLFRYEVFSAGSVNTPSYQNAFCAESDVERYLLQPIHTGSKPNDTEVASFAEGRAAILMSLCASLGHEVTPSTVTPGSRLEKLLREANAIGAAIDARVSQSFATGKEIPDSVASWMERWTEYVGGPKPGFITEITGLIEKEISGNTVSLSTSHVLSGDTTARADEGAPQDVGLQIRMGDMF